MQNVMVDLETLGTVPGCAILSIGAVAFCPRTQTLGERLYIEINRHNTRQAGLKINESTLAWWKTQPGGLEFLARTDSGGEILSTALTGLTYFLEQFDLKEVRVWGNGSDFDNAILAAAYDAIGLETPWKFWNNRCFRTLKSVCGHGLSMPRTGVHHNALDDAVTQANLAMKILGKMGA